MKLTQRSILFRLTGLLVILLGAHVAYGVSQEPVDALWDLASDVGWSREELRLQSVSYDYEFPFRYVAEAEWRTEGVDRVDQSVHLRARKAGPGLDWVLTNLETQ